MVIVNVSGGRFCQWDFSVEDRGKLDIDLRKREDCKNENQEKNGPHNSIMIISFVFDGFKS